MTELKKEIGTELRRLEEDRKEKLVRLKSFVKARLEMITHSITKNNADDIRDEIKALYLNSNSMVETIETQSARIDCLRDLNRIEN